MNTLFRNHASYATVLTVAAALTFTLAGCATVPVSRSVGRQCARSCAWTTTR